MTGEVCKGRLPHETGWRLTCRCTGLHAAKGRQEMKAVWLAVHFRGFASRVKCTLLSANDPSGPQHRQVYNQPTRPQGNAYRSAERAGT